MTVIKLYEYLNCAMPPSLSLDWDNDGIMCCSDFDREVNRVLYTLDVTTDSVQYAVEHNFNVIISHHPLIFKPLNKITSAKLIYLIKNEISVMSFHTRMDIINNGINDIFAAKLSMKNVVPFAGGAGRIGALEDPVLFEIFGSLLKNILGADKINAVNAQSRVYKIAVVSGSGADFIAEAISLCADTFITGECGYHRLIDAKEEGINVFEAGHFYTENFSAQYIKELILGCGSVPEFEIYEKNPILTI